VRAARLAVLPAIVLISLLALLALPAAALAADPVTVSGTVVHGGAPVTGVQVVVSVTGSDQIVAATTDENGAFSVQVDAGVGAEVRIDATGQTSRSNPDAKNCVHVETPTGTLTITVEALPLDPVEVAMDDVLTGTVCGPTDAPHVTPPSTDAATPGPGRSSGAGLLILLGGLALVAGGTLALARRWH
jgi:hypothetical protein